MVFTTTSPRWPSPLQGDHACHRSGHEGSSTVPDPDPSRRNTIRIPRFGDGAGRSYRTISSVRAAGRERLPARIDLDGIVHDADADADRIVRATWLGPPTAWNVMTPKPLGPGVIVFGRKRRGSNPRSQP